MAFGDPSAAEWGTPEWGLILPENGALFQLDSLAQALNVERTFLLDAVGATLNVQRSFLLDALALGSAETGFALDFADEGIPDAVLRALDVAPYLLVRLTLPAGPQRVAARWRSAMGQSWDGRLIGTGDVLRTLTEGTDDVSLVLDDTDMNGQVRFRTLFQANDPEGSLVEIWLGAEGIEDHEHVLIFVGKLEAVTSFSEVEVRLQVVRRETVEDRVLCRLVSQTDFPNAPPDSISRAIPLAFGSLTTHEGVVIDSNALSTLAVGMTISDLQLQVAQQDWAGFPASGTLRIEDEQVTYTSKTAPRTIVLSARGAGGTVAAPHPRGAEVSEVGTFVVKFADHPVSNLINPRIELPNGNLGEPVPEPSALDLSQATFTWPATPRIRDADAPAVFMRVHFNTADPSNTALNPQFAARVNPGYDAFKYASFNTGQQLALRTSTEGLGEPGDIQRVWLGVIFDPRSLQGRNPAQVRVDGIFRTLLATDTVPEDIARSDERTGDRFYEIPPPTIDVTPAASQPFRLTPSEVVHPGVWTTVDQASRVVDQNEETFAAFMFVGIGEAAIVGTADAIFKLPEGGSGILGEGTPTDARLVFIAGWTFTPQTSYFDVWLRKDGKEIPGTRFKACTGAPSGLCAGLISGIERFEKELTPEIVALIDDSTEWVVHPALGVSNGLWVGRELFIEGNLQPPDPVVAVEQDSRNSVTNYFELTDRVKTTPAPGGISVPGWSWFSDLNRGGVVRFLNVGAADGVRIIETFYVVEHRPFVDAASLAPRVFADVVGRVPSGNPVEIARSLVTLASPQGLGLSVDRIDQAAYLLASASLAADGVRADFAVSQQVSALGLLRELAAQTDCRETWDEGKHTILRRPRADQALPVVVEVKNSDVLAPPAGRGVEARRSPQGDVRNRFSVTWRTYAPKGEPARAKVLTGTTTGVFGTQEEELALTLIADDATAELVATRKLERVERPRWIVDLDLPIYGVRLKRGQLVKLSTRMFSFQVCEVVGLTLGAARFKRVSVTLAVWLA